MAKKLPRYPIYIPSRGRYDRPLTINALKRDGVPFQVVVEPQEMDHYAVVVGAENVLVLPWDNPGSVIPARNFIFEHAKQNGHARHWQLDDNIRSFMRWYRKRRVRCDAGLALSVLEDFVDRYTNVAIAGLNYTMFACAKLPPFNVNCRIYSCNLINNSVPHRFRGRYNEDTDFCLQVLADGWCTVLMHAFLCEKLWTMTTKGGNTRVLYEEQDGRLKMAKALERMWPGVVSVNRRFQRPQHVVADYWKRFDTPLERRTDIDWSELENIQYDMQLKQVREEIKSPRVRKLLQEYDGR